MNIQSSYILKTISVLLCFTFLSCSRKNVLKVVKHKYYTQENTMMWEEKELKLSHRVFYNHPSYIDEEFFLDLVINITDTSALRSKQYLNIKEDSSLVKVQYSIASIWDGHEENESIQGEIKLISLTEQSITIKENILVDDKRENVMRKFKGIQTFTLQTDD